MLKNDDSSSSSNNNSNNNSKAPARRSVSFPVTITTTAVLLAIVLLSLLLPVLLVFADANHRRLIGHITLQRAALMRDRITGAVNASYEQNQQGANFSRRAGLPLASNASIRRYMQFERFATDGEDLAGSRAWLTCRYSDGSFVQIVYSRGFLQLQLTATLPSPGQSAPPRFDPAIHTGFESENQSFVAINFLANSTSLRAFSTSFFPVSRFPTRSWIDSVLWKNEPFWLPALTRQNFPGGSEVTTYQHIRPPVFLTGSTQQFATCTTAIAHSSFAKYLKTLLVGADQGARAYIFDKLSNLVIGQSHGAVFKLSNTTTTPPPLPKRCVSFRTDVACFPDPLSSYPLLAALGWKNLSRPLPGGNGLLLLEDTEVAGTSSSFSVVVAELNNHNGPLFPWRLYVFTPVDLLYGGVRAATGVAVGIAVACTVVATIVGAILLRSVSHVVSDLADRLEADPWQMERRNSGDSGSSSNVTGSVFGVIAAAVLRCCSFQELVQVEEEHRKLRRVIEQLRGFMKQAVLLKRPFSDDDGSARTGSETDSGHQQQQQREQAGEPVLCDPGLMSDDSSSLRGGAKSRRRVRFEVRDQQNDGADDDDDNNNNNNGGGLEPQQGDGDDASSSSATDVDGDEGEPAAAGPLSPQRRATSRRQQQRGAPRAHTSKSMYEFIAPSLGEKKSVQLVCCVWVQFPFLHAMLRALEKGDFAILSPSSSNNNNNNNNTNAGGGGGGNSSHRQQHQHQQLEKKEAALQDVVDVSAFLATLVALLIKKNPIVCVTEFFGDGLVLCFSIRSLAAKSRVLVSVLRHAIQLATALPNFCCAAGRLCEWSSIAHLAPTPPAEASPPPESSSSAAAEAAATTTTTDEASSSSCSAGESAAAAAAAPAPPRRAIMVRENFMSVGVFAGAARVLESAHESLHARQFVFLGHSVANAARICGYAAGEPLFVNSAICDTGPPDRAEGVDEEGFIGPASALPRVVVSDGDGDGDNSADAAAARSPTDSDPPTPNTPAWLQSLQGWNPRRGAGAAAATTATAVVGGELPTVVSDPTLRQTLSVVVAHTIAIPRALIPTVLPGRHRARPNDPRPVVMQAPLAPASIPRPAVVKLAVPVQRLAWCAAAAMPDSSNCLADDVPVVEERQSNDYDDGNNTEHAYFALGRLV